MPCPTPQRWKRSSRRPSMRDEQYRAILEARTRRPGAVAEAAARRARPASLFNEHGKLMIIAADHPARGALRAGQRAMAMADRVELLDRLCLALSRPGVGGVLGTADEVDDRFTAYDAAAIAAAGYQGGKMLLRIDPDDPATARTVEACGRAVAELAAGGLLALVEPFIVHRVDGRLRPELTPEAMIRAVTVAAGLGTTSAHTWLKVPVVDQMERVMAATTLPALLLGGEVGADQEATLAGWRKALALPTVHGLVVGRALLYPPDDDVAAVVAAAAALLQEEAAA